MKFDRKSFVEGMGDSELTLDSYNSAPQEDELGEVHYPEEKQEEPATESPAAEPEAEKPQQESQEEKMTPDEYRRVIDAQNQIYLKSVQDYFEQKIAQLVPQNKQSEPSQEDEEDADPFTRLERREAANREAASQALALAERAAESLMRSNFERTVQKLATDIPDLHEFIPQDRLKMVLEEAVKRKAFDTNWEDAISAAHRNLSHNKYREHYHKSKDELAQKREEKKAESAKAVRAVPSGGSTYQATPKKDLNPNSNPNYAKDRKRAFLDELNAITGG